MRRSPFVSDHRDRAKREPRFERYRMSPATSVAASTAMSDAMHAIIEGISSLPHGVGELFAF